MRPFRVCATIAIVLKRKSRVNHIQTKPLIRRFLSTFSLLWLALLPAVLADDMSDFYQNDPYRDFRNIALRDEGGVALIVQEGKKDRTVEALIDGVPEVSDLAKVEGLPFNIVIRFGASTDLEAIRIFSGNPELAANPSGDCGIRSCRISVEQAGEWHDVKMAIQSFPSFEEMKAKGLYTYNFSIPCKQKSVSAVKIEVLSSTDTGKRIDTKELVAPAKRVCYLREIEVFSSEKVAVSESLPIRASVDVDFRLPVYTEESSADLVLEPKGGASEARIFQVDFFEGIGKTKIRTIEDISCPPSARTTVPVPIGDLKTGLYRAEVFRSEERDQFLTRWLRIQRPAIIAPLPEPLDISMGRKLLFLDDRCLKEQQGFFFEKQKAEALQVLQENVEPGDIINQGRAFFRGRDGKFYFRFESMPIKAQSVIGYVRPEAKKKAYTAVSEDLTSWTVSPGNLGTPVPKDQLLSPVAHNGSITLGNVKTCRLYDQAKDGPIPLGQVKMVFSGYKDVQWGDQKIPARSVYPVWQKSPDTVLLLQADPLMQMSVSTADEVPGNWADINDNWGGQWLGADGKTLYFMVGAMVPRRSPFIVPYDNVTNADRLLVLWKTTDGLNWTHSFVAPPRASDPTGWQNYGMSHAPYRGAGVRIGFLFPYDSWRQQIYVDILYSYDDENWLRPDPEKRFADNGRIGAWNFGAMFASPDQTVEKDDNCYTPVLTAYSQPHFSYLWAFRDEEQNADLFERLFSEKGIEGWPFWKDVGGSFAEMAAKFKSEPDIPFRTFGLLKYRIDGFVAMTAGNRQAEATTRLLTGRSKSVQVNMRSTKTDGFLKIEVLDAEGNTLPDYCDENAATITGDHINAQVQWKHAAVSETPAADDYRLKLTGRDVEIFSLSFQ